jgi:hypothetical protein
VPENNPTKYKHYSLLEVKRKEACFRDDVEVKEKYFIDRLAFPRLKEDMSS